MKPIVLIWKNINNKCMQKIFFLNPIFLALVMFLTSCVTFPNCSGSQLPPELQTAEETEWETVSPFIQRYDYRNSKMDYHIVCIDLNAKWEIVSYPEKKGWVRPVSVGSFARRSNSDIAINANPFLFTSRIIWWSKIKPIGVCRTDSRDVSAFEPRFCSLNFYKDEDGTYRAEIEDSQDMLNEKNPIHAYGGFFTVYRDGKVYEFQRINDVRSAAAVSDNGKKLYLMVGKNLSFEDTAEIFKALGCDAAMEFDGGSSSQMTVNKRYVFFNFPPRKVASVFGLRLLK